MTNKFTSSNAENIQWIHLTTDVKFSHNMQLNVLDDLAEAMKALDGKKVFWVFLFVLVGFVFLLFSFLHGDS